MAGFLNACIRSRITALVGLAVIAASVFLPPEGPPLPLCQFKNVTGLPCMGCGLTRSFIGMGHLDPARAWFFHPWGVLLFSALVLLTGLSLLPGRVQDRIGGWLEGKAAPARRVGWGLVIGFLLYGGVRLVYCLWLRSQALPVPW